MPSKKRDWRGKQRLRAHLLRLYSEDSPRLNCFLITQPKRLLEGRRL